VLHLRRADLSLTRALQRRPAEAEAWLLLGWARVRLGRDDGLPLARHGADLDPSRASLRRAVQELESALASVR
jgi:hypothetical protein